MKSPVLLCSTVSLLALSACATAPSDRSITLRHGKVTVTENVPAAVAAPLTVTAPAPIVHSEPDPIPVAPVSVTTPPVSLPEPTPTPVVVAPVVIPEPAAPVVVSTPGLQATRDGSIVQLGWTLPESASGYRAIEIMRNTQEQATGRTRVRAVRATVTQLEDTLPDAAANYWYWLKLTHADGTVQNFGPVATAPAN